MTCAHYARETFRIYHLDAPPKLIMDILYDTKAPGYLINDKTERKTGSATYLDMTIANAIKKRRNPPMKR